MRNNINITDAGGLWRLTEGKVENRKTNEVRWLDRMPNPQLLEAMHEKTFVQKCRIAFESGSWPD